MQRSRWRASGAIAVVLTLALVAAACGSSSKKSSSGGTATTAAANQPKGEPIKLMTITSLTGPSVLFPDAPTGAQAAAKAINDAGGVKDPAGGANRPIQIEVCDDGYDPNKAADCARKAVSDKVVAMVGNISAHGDVYGPIAFAAGIPLVGIQASSAAESTNALSYPINGGSVVSLLSEVGFLAKQGVKKVTLEHIQNAAADFLVNAMKKKAESLGMTVVNDILVPSDATDMTTYAARFTSSGAEGALMVEPSDRISKIITALNQAGVDLQKFKMTGDLSQSDLKKLGDAASGFYGAGYSFPVTATDNAGVKQFNKEYAALGTSTAASGYSIQSWVATHVIADLLGKAKAIDSASLVEQMKAAGPISRPEYAPWDWTAPADVIPGLPLRAFGTKLLIAKADKGKFTPVTTNFTSYL